MSLQDSQLQFYDAIEYFSSYSESDEDSEDTDGEGNGEATNSANPVSSSRRNRQIATVPGIYSLLLFFSTLKIYLLLKTHSRG